MIAADKDIDKLYDLSVKRVLKAAKGRESDAGLRAN
jgi:hypothetical protein